MTALLTDVPFSVGGLAKATFIGAASAAVTFGIGSAAGSLFTNFFSKAAFQAVAHGAFQGGMTAILGGKFWSGFAAGALSSIAASAWSGGATVEHSYKFNADMVWEHAGLGAGTGTAGMIAFGTVAGGAGAALTGGNFWQGAVTGLVVSGLNHYAHSGDGPGDPPGKKETKYKISKEQLEQFQNPEPTEFGMGLMEWVEGGAPLKGVQWLNKMVGKYGPETITTVEKVGSKYYKYSAEVAGRNGKTIYTKYLNMEGKTVQWFHDSYDATNKFMHREFNAAGGRLKVWWDGAREYIQKF